MTVEIEGIVLHLAHPDELAVEWVGQEELMRQLLAATYFTDLGAAYYDPTAEVPEPGRLGWRWRLKMARAALGGFTKFRGFVAADSARKAELYREALRFNPADENVRELLARLEGSGHRPVE